MFQIKQRKIVKAEPVNTISLLLMLPTAIMLWISQFGMVYLTFMGSYAMGNIPGPAKIIPLLSLVLSFGGLAAVFFTQKVTKFKNIHLAFCMIAFAGVLTLTFLGFFKPDGAWLKDPYIIIATLITLTAVVINRRAKK